jgi:hypothetical protein
VGGAQDGDPEVAVSEELGWTARELGEGDPVEGWRIEASIPAR